MNWKPKRKVNAGLVAGFLQAAFVWVWNGRAIQPPITAELASAALPVFSFIVSWLVPDAIEEDKS